MVFLPFACRAGFEPGSITMVVKVAAIMRTNVPARSLHKEFLNKFSDKLAKEFYTEVQVAWVTPP